MILQLLIACSSLAFGAIAQGKAGNTMVEEFPLIDFLSTRDNYSCPDSDLGNLCDTECRVDYIGCRQECSEIYCENACVAEYSDCLSSCPCGLNCPDGCEGCAHPLCTLSPCEDLDNNADYQRCKKEFTKELNECVDECKNSLMCIDECTDEYKKNLFDCPCFGGCPQSCPFCSNYDCEPERFVVFHQYGAYLMNTDGTIEERRYDTPTGLVDYTYQSSGAVLRGVFYIFGGQKGTNTYKKIAKLNGCRFEELAITLPYNHRYQNAAVTLQDDSQVLVCFSDQLSYKRCQFFNGETAGLDTNEMLSYHQYGCVAHYKDNIIALGDIQASPYNFVELRDPSTKQWSKTTDHPYTGYYRWSACLAVSDGTISLGGVDRNIHVYLFKMEKWSSIGTLNSAHNYPAAIQYNDEIYTVGDTKNEYFIYDNTELVDYIDIEASVLYTNNVANNQQYALILDFKYDSCI